MAEVEIVPKHCGATVEGAWPERAGSWSRCHWWLADVDLAIPEGRLTRVPAILAEASLHKNGAQGWALAGALGGAHGG